MLFSDDGENHHLRIHAAQALCKADAMIPVGNASGAHLRSPSSRSPRASTQVDRGALRKYVMDIPHSLATLEPRTEFPWEL
jgi:hypothetical protein